MRKNKAFGGITELQIFSKMLNINLLLYIRYINNRTCKKMDSDNIKLMIINNNNNYEGDFALLLDDYGGKREKLNHFQSIHNKNGIQIPSEKIFEIKEYFLKQKHFYDIGKDLLKIKKEVEIKYVFEKINKKKEKKKYNDSQKCEKNRGLGGQERKRKKIEILMEKMDMLDDDKMLILIDYISEISPYAVGELEDGTINIDIPKMKIIDLQKIIEFQNEIL